MNENNSHTLKCHSCRNSQIVQSEKNVEASAVAHQWGVVFDTGNGLSTKLYCPSCFLKAQELAVELAQIIKLDHFHFRSLLKGKC